MCVHICTTWLMKYKLILKRFLIHIRIIAKSDYWVCHVCPYGTIRLPLDKFSLNLKSEYFSTMCGKKIQV